MAHISESSDGAKRTVEKREEARFCAAAAVAAATVLLLLLLLLDFKVLDLEVTRERFLPRFFWPPLLSLPPPVPPSLPPPADLVSSSLPPRRL